VDSNLLDQLFAFAILRVLLKLFAKYYVLRVIVQPFCKILRKYLVQIFGLFETSELNFGNMFNDLNDVGWIGKMNA
jgi:hypothetical protein